MDILLTKKRKVKKIKEIDTKFQYYHSLLIGECFQILQRIEVISHSNLVYSQKYTENFKRYLDIVNKFDKHCSKHIEILDDHILDPKRKGFKEDFQAAKKSLETFKNEVNSLNETLLEIIKPEEDARSQALLVKEYAAVIKKKYIQNNSSFEMANPSFEKIFNAIDRKFQKFDNLIDSAEYDEAIAILPKIRKVLDELNRVIGLLPKICVSILNDIPRSISLVEIKFENLDGEKIPLMHLAPKSTISNFRTEVENIKNLIKNLKVEEATKRINQLSINIDEFSKLLDKEEESKKFYDENFSEIYDSADVLGKKIIDIYNDIPNIKAVYEFDDLHKDIVSELQTKEKELANARRNLDVNLITTTRQPYSLIIDKLVILKNVTKETEDNIASFNKYILNLNDDCKRAFDLIATEYAVLRKNLVVYESLHLADDDYRDNFNHLYDLLDDISNILKNKPIDVIALNRNLNEYKRFSQDLYDLVNNIHDKKIQCEKYISTLVKMKVDFASIEASMNVAENLYKQTKYAEACNILDGIYKDNINII